MIIKRNNQKLREKVKKAETVQETAPINNAPPPKTEQVEALQTKPQEEPEIDLFDIENIDFSQRQERRRGSRRRGYRRIDDRNLVSRAQEEAEIIKNARKEYWYAKLHGHNKLGDN